MISCSTHLPMCLPSGSQTGGCFCGERLEALEAPVSLSTRRDKRVAGSTGGIEEEAVRLNERGGEPRMLLRELGRRDDPLFPPHLSNRLADGLDRSSKSKKGESETETKRSRFSQKLCK